MRTSPVLPLKDDPSMGQSRKVNTNDVSILKQHSSKTLLSSLLNSASSVMQQGILPNDGLIPSATSSCSIITEYGNQRCYEEARQDKEVDELSVATEFIDREGAECRDCGTEDESPPSTVATKKVAEKQVKREDLDEASKGSKTKKMIKKVKQLKKAISTPSASKSTSTKEKQTQKAAQKVTLVAKNTTASGISATPSTNVSSNKNDQCWTGRIVGLRLPSDVDSDFDSKCKPFERRVDPSKFTGGGEAANEKVMRGADGWNPWNEATNIAVGNTVHGAKLNAADHDTMMRHDTMIPFNAQSAKGMNIALDIYLFNQNDPSNKPIKIHMIRDPNEEVSKTLSRLQLSVQKKIGGKKKKQKKGKKAEPGASKQSEEAVLLKKKLKVGKVPAAVQPTLFEEDNSDDDTATLWDGFYDAMLPINGCNPWSDNIQCGNHEEQLAGESENLESNCEASGDDDDRIIMEGYERVEYTNSLTINEVLHRAATLVDDLGRYALSVPIVASNNNSSDTTSCIPLLLDSCPPTITSVSTFGSFNESHLFEQTPIVVEVGVLYATKVQIMWFADGKQVCGDSPCYTPANADVDKVLTVVIVPLRPNHDGTGCEEAYQFKRRVEALPSLPLVRPLREEFLNRPQQQHCDDSDPTLRVVTYNILADQNASRDVDKNDDADRMYSHCKNEHIVKWRRHPLIVHEILEYRPDVISLQEVDTDVFTNLLKPVMQAKGYEGYYSQKGVDARSGVREGCAIFWSLDVFESVRPVDMHTHTFRDMIQQFSCEERMHKAQWKSLSDMADLLDKHDHLKHVLFNKLGHIMQTVVLTQRKSQEKVVIGNSHLFYHPMASHIRCLKILMACRQLEIEHNENQMCPIIFCGDFNSHPNSGVMKLLLNRYLDSNNGKTWKHLCSYEWEEGAGGELHHDVEAIDLELPPSFPGFMSAYPDPPEFTHFIEAFVCTLDYILMTDNFVLEKSGATPSREDVKKYIAMPNECMPSDHVSLVCDLKWG